MLICDRSAVAGKGATGATDAATSGRGCNGGGGWATQQSAGGGWGSTIVTINWMLLSRVEATYEAKQLIEYQIEVQSEAKYSIFCLLFSHHNQNKKCIIIKYN